MRCEREKVKKTVDLDFEKGSRGSRRENLTLEFSRFQLSSDLNWFCNIMSENMFASSNFWPTFSRALQLFKLLGVMPVTLVKIKDKKGENLKVEFSKHGFVIAVIFFVLSLIHIIWAPTVLITLEQSIVASVLKARKTNVSMTDEFRGRNLNTKLGIVVKILHPVLVCLTALTARFLGVFVLATSLPVVFKAVARVDRSLSMPSNFYLVHFGSMSMFTFLSLLVHVPIFAFHLLKVWEYHSFWENVWECFTLFNICTSFALELEFVLFCLGTLSRFNYVNNLLRGFVSEDFLYDSSKRRKLEKVFLKWKGYVRAPSRKIFSNKIKTKKELSKLFSKMDAANGERYLETSENFSLISANRRKKGQEPESFLLLKSLRCAHVLLFDVLEKVNDTYQIHLLVSISTAVTEILFNFYFTIFGFVSSSVSVPGKVQNSELYLLSAWSVYYSLRFLLVVSAAHFTASAPKNTSKIISKIDSGKFEFPSKQEIKMLSDHLSRRDFEFSACGLFNLNPSLISTSFSTGITYLVIMAQFH